MQEATTADETTMQRPPGRDPSASSRSGTVLEQLEGLIVSGAFGDGERLDEVRLAERFNVSRTPLREAFHRLAASGLIEQVPRRGAFVRHPSPTELVEMFEVMAELEAFAGTQASRRATSAQLQAIADAATTCEEAVSHGDADAYFERNELFHRAIYEASNNSFLCAQAERLHRRLRPFRRLQLHVRGRVEQSMKEHRAIVDALQVGDAVAAARALREHITVQGERFGDLVAGLRNAKATAASDRASIT